MKMSQKICLLYDTESVRKSGLNHGIYKRENMSMYVLFKSRLLSRIDRSGHFQLNYFKL